MMDTKSISLLMMDTNSMSLLLANLLKIRRQRFKEIEKLVFSNIEHCNVHEQDTKQCIFAALQDFTNFEVGKQKNFSKLLKNQKCDVWKSVYSNLGKWKLDKLKNERLDRLIISCIVYGHVPSTNDDDGKDKHESYSDVVFKFILIGKQKKDKHDTSQTILKDISYYTPYKGLHFDTLQTILNDILHYTLHNEMPHLRAIPFKMNKLITELFMNIISVSISNTDIQPVVNEIKEQFVNLLVQTIKNKLDLNLQAYIELQSKLRIESFIKKAETKMKMRRIKGMKALFYQGINGSHHIQPNSGIQQRHVLALILYSQISDLCTKFRETYRKISSDESDVKQIQRHSKFAQFGCLLYESFVFYGSIDSEVETLYHGMSMELLFSTTYCTLDAPTSTTTARSVACNFGGGAGIVMALESSRSTKYIKTLDMDLFTCFHDEEEHLIFETRLHIKN
eukprot:124069_1